MLQLIISIISSSGCRSGNEWHASASLDMRHSGLNEWWNEARWEKNKTASWEKKAKEWRKKKLWMSAKVTGECTISYNSELNPTKKKKETAERKVTLQWPWNYWFHRKRLLEKQAQLLSVLTSLVPDHCFQGCGWIHPVVFIFVWHFTSACKKQKNIKTTLHRARQFLECENINIAKLLERLFISCLFSVFN